MIWSGSAYSDQLIYALLRFFGEPLGVQEIHKAYEEHSETRRLGDSLTESLRQVARVTCKIIVYSKRSRLLSSGDFLLDMVLDLVLANRYGSLLDGHPLWSGALRVPRVLIGVCWTELRRNDTAVCAVLQRDALMAHTEVHENVCSPFSWTS